MTVPDSSDMFSLSVILVATHFGLQLTDSTSLI